ncbi:hypothetical protein ASG40_17815 [Methylobacterium sp. Leaf399]|uniref:DUF1656 domain-containing protein n=1 Tax=unclassified Methylobacterium TaxID=2615210 RepID=UPI0006F4BD0F|nr:MULTISPECIES: DUF1656 domain-containing protein [unclassified Methylobacterium]KQP48859.1 hypothetical protein ASF39_13920 [Methylobacterium sp. Leaf108]KQT16552.1 hypothetical protein ASG40_17815 [Methylobacterium sp. Leaf399]KQT86615.1 hypothetical protein ASG59_17150 [Methylobacterium sp. Leaf466]
MFHDLDIGGVLVSPFLAYAAGALLLLVLLRRLFAGLRLSRYVANPPLAEAGIYVCLLALLIVFL